MKLVLQQHGMVSWRLVEKQSAETEKPLAAFLTHDAIKKHLFFMVQKDASLISPDNWESDYAFMQRPNAVRVNLNLFYDYRKNVGYPVAEFLRKQQPKTIIF